MNIFINDERKKLIQFKEKHQNLNLEEKKVISDTIDTLAYTKTAKHGKVMKNMISSLQELSVSDRLSQDGQDLLRKSQREQGFLRIFTDMIFARY